MHLQCLHLTGFYKLILIFCVIALTACQNEKKQEDPPEDYNLKIEFKTSNLQLDSIMLKSANRKKQMTAVYKNNAALFLVEDSINDLYDLKLYTHKKIINKKIWLKGQNIHIKGKLAPQISIDTVINSPLYYTIQENSKILRRLYEEDEKNPEIDAYLLTKIKELLASPISFAMADTYMYRNQNNLKKLQDLKVILDQQSQNLKTHSLSVHANLNNTIAQLKD
ncbi:hypothetical protein ACFQ3R_11235 [Mesonia ostreae]|uniref:DUF4369 domain-containing protein n=1 Tax=Mesonia ostreae TaxID=861110 RepID=A0ABU2KGY3_9FLAO|nr:hypothetical protein [Mesonia ostreae]MDT0293954.1 hypothetical protein [Mesonia ostreae]